MLKKFLAVTTALCFLTAPAFGGGISPPAGTNVGSGVIGVLPPQNGGTGVANNAASTLTVSGAFGLTVTLTGATGLTFPTSGTVTALGNTTTGSGSIVLATSPTLVTPNLGTPSAGNLANTIGLPISTGVSGLGTGVATLLGGASSGTGGPVGTTSPIITTPTISGALTGSNGTAVAPSINFGDAGTGLYRPALNQLSISTGGVQLVNFTSTGLALMVTNATITNSAGYLLLNAPGGVYLQNNGNTALQASAGGADFVTAAGGASGATISTNAGTLLINSAAGVTTLNDASVRFPNIVVIGSGLAVTGTAGDLGIAKVTASANAPGAGFGKLEVVAGTNAGTCKLQMYAGTSATPVTVVDNVGAGC